MKGNSDHYRERIHSSCSLNKCGLHQLGQDNQEKHLENLNWEWKPGFKNVLPLVLVSSSLVLHPMSVQRQYPSATFHEGGAFLPQENVSSANSAHSTHHKLLIGRFLKLFQIASSSSKTGWTCTVYFSEVRNKIRCDLEKFEGFDDLSSNHLNFMVKC